MSHTSSLTSRLVYSGQSTLSLRPLYARRLRRGDKSAIMSFN